MLEAFMKQDEHLNIDKVLKFYNTHIDRLHINTIYRHYRYRVSKPLIVYFKKRFQWKQFEFFAFKALQKIS